MASNETMYGYMDWTPGLEVTTLKMVYISSTGVCVPLCLSSLHGTPVHGNLPVF